MSRWVRYRGRIAERDDLFDDRYIDFGLKGTTYSHFLSNCQSYIIRWLWVLSLLWAVMPTLPPFVIYRLLVE